MPTIKGFDKKKGFRFFFKNLIFMPKVRVELWKFCWKIYQWNIPEG